MPQLLLFNRRWYSSTDTQPVWAIVYGMLHSSVLVSTLVLALMMRGGDYTCNIKTQIIVFFYGILVIVCLLLLGDIMICSLGLRGGPFEEKKRILVKVALYAQFSLNILLIGWALYGTLLGYSEKAETSCWSSSPCKSIQYLVPQACVDIESLKQNDVTAIEETGYVVISQGCQYLSDHRAQTLQCLTVYMDLAVTFAKDAYNNSLTPPFDVDNTPVSCDLSREYFGRDDFESFNNETGYYLDDLLNWGVVFNEILNDTSYSNYALDNLIIFSLRRIGVVNESTHLIRSDKDATLPIYDNIAYSAPWASCKALSSCENVLNSKCDQWDILLRLPSGQNEKGLFRAIVWVSWGSIFFSLLLYYLIFNSNPDYTSSESWMRALEKISSWFGFRSVLQDSITEEGFSASEELGILLVQLFGGIDMDLTDRLLGVYLAGERMRWRRLKTVQKYLGYYGYTFEQKKISCWTRCFQGVGIDGRQEALQGMFDAAETSENLTEGSTFEGHAISKPSMGISAPRGILPTPFSLERGSQFELIRNSVYCTHSHVDSADSSVMTPPGPISVAQSIVRLDSSMVPSLDEQSSGNTFSERRGSSVVSANKSIKLMLPVDISDLNVVPNIDTKAAARIYLDDCLGFVSESILKDVHHYSWFAKAAYGLQQKRWKASKTGDCMKDCVDGLLSSKLFPSCIGNMFGVKGRFRKRNFDAILKFTGIPAEDFLYVSYTSTTFGLLPYLVMLDRERKKLIISIRGTVGLEDLITDLLSTPVEINSMLPEYVLDKLSKSEDGTITKLYGHAGIISSAKAIIESLKEEGVLSTILEYEHMEKEQIRELATLRSENFTRQVARLSDSSEVRFDLQRAQTAVYDALRGDSYDVVITGHSLGAAVASLVAVSLRGTYSNLECYAFNPPGGLVSPELSNITKDFCYSIVVGHDAISRLSINNVRALIDDVVYSLCRCKRAKLKILMDIVLGNRRNPSTAPRTYCSFEKLDDSIKAILEQYTSHSLVHTQHLDSRPLVPMGQVIFLRPYPMRDNRGMPTMQWDAVFAEPGDIVREGIIVSRNALSHHQISSMQNALEFCIESQKYDYDTVL